VGVEPNTHPSRISRLAGDQVAPGRPRNIDADQPGRAGEVGYQQVLPVVAGSNEQGPADVVATVVSA